MLPETVTSFDFGSLGGTSLELFHTALHFGHWLPLNRSPHDGFLQTLLRGIWNYYCMSLMKMFKLYIFFTCCFIISFMYNKSKIHTLAVTICCKNRFHQHILLYTHLLVYTISYHRIGQEILNYTAVIALHHSQKEEKVPTMRKIFGKFKKSLKS